MNSEMAYYLSMAFSCFMFELHLWLPICLLLILFVKQGRDGSAGPVGQPGVPGEKVKHWLV